MASHEDAQKDCSVNREFTDFRVVRPEHLNHYGCLFGGYLLQIIDEMAYIACSMSFPGRNFVTRAMQDVEFHAPAHLGDILETTTVVEQICRSSVHVHAQVFIADSTGTRKRKKTFDGTVIFVCVGDNGESRAVVG